MTDSQTPVAPSFPQAVAMSGEWLGAWDLGEFSDEVLADRVGDLVRNRDGARGFFVVALPADSPLMDRLPETLVVQLRLAGAGVVDLMVRNLAMSTAMAVEHERSGDRDQQARSARVRARSTELLRHLDPWLVKERLETLLVATKGKGEDVAFLDRWGYDAQQRSAIATAALAVASPGSRE